VIEFVEECRREWRRLGVPDPIANEMAIDLTADIEEAESEGGSAEDVLGNSFFDPRRFAAAWAGARGVTAPPAPPVLSAPFVAPAPAMALTAPTTLAAPDRLRRRRWPVLAVALALILAFIAAATLLVGRHSVAVASPVRRILAVPGAAAQFRYGPVNPPFHIFLPDASIGGPHSAALQILVLLLLMAGVAGLGLAALYAVPWTRRQLNLTTRLSGRTGGTERPDGSST
jgi:hypothetical protein